MFKVEHLYTKNEIYELLNVPIAQRKGNWNTGYNIYNDEIYIFANVGIPGRTGHDYNNYWDGEIFVWEAKGQSNINQPTIKKMLDPNAKINIFTRIDDKSPFTFEGLATAQEHIDTSPVIVKWSFNNTNEIRDERTPNEANSKQLFTIGAASKAYVNKYERNPLARRLCIKHYGAVCLVCNFDFEKKYGEYGKGFIHVHHIIPLSKILEGYTLDPITDLVPVCPNCHSMIHRSIPPLTIDELRIMIQ